MKDDIDEAYTLMKKALQDFRHAQQKYTEASFRYYKLLWRDKEKVDERFR